MCVALMGSLLQAPAPLERRILLGLMDSEWFVRFYTLPSLPVPG